MAKKTKGLVKFLKTGQFMGVELFNKTTQKTFFLGEF